MSPPPLLWKLFVLTSILAGAGPFGLASAGMPDGEFDEELEFFCTPGDSPGEACVSLYVDEDGFEICLFDQTAKTENCMSSYSQPDNRGKGYDAPKGPQQFI